MPRPKNKSLNLHVTTSARFVAHLKKLGPNSSCRAKQNYLLCKCAIERRQQEIQERRAQGKDIVQLERMVLRLEASMRAHKKIIDQHSDDD